VVIIEGGVVKKCKSVVKTIKTVVNINCIMSVRGRDRYGRILPPLAPVKQKRLALVTQAKGA
jgi:hypothetical protein